MQLTHRARLGALALCAALSATACSSSGKTQPDPPLVESRIVEAAREQLVPISATLTDVPELPPLPPPAVSYGTDGCDRALGCYSSRQLESALGAALDWGQRSADNLRAIRRAGEAATATNKGPPQ